MAKKSKKYVEALNKIDRTRLYDATEALSLVAEVATAKFDETVDQDILTILEEHLVQSSATPAKLIAPQRAKSPTGVAANAIAEAFAE